MTKQKLFLYLLFLVGIGRRVTTPTKGIFVKDGRKFVNK